VLFWRALHHPQQHTAPTLHDEEPDIYRQVSIVIRVQAEPNAESARAVRGSVSLVRLTQIC
jgi:hypothetical protein